MRKHVDFSYLTHDASWNVCIYFVWHLIIKEVNYLPANYLFAHHLSITTYKKMNTTIIPAISLIGNPRWLPWFGQAGTWRPLYDTRPSPSHHVSWRASLKQIHGQCLHLWLLVVCDELHYIINHDWLYFLSSWPHWQCIKWLHLHFLVLTNEPYTITASECHYQFLSSYVFCIHTHTP